MAIQGMYLSADEIGRSARPLGVEDGPGGGLGRPSHSPGAVRETDRFYRELESWAEQWFGARVITTWSAQDYVSADAVPFIGRMPTTERIMVATGFGKWGFSNATIGAHVLADRVEG